MKPNELRDISDDALVEHIATVRRDFFGLRMQHATGELDNTARLRFLRRDLFGLRFQHATGELENTAGLKTQKRELARALTIARERGIDTDK